MFLRSKRVAELLERKTMIIGNAKKILFVLIVFNFALQMYVQAGFLSNDKRNGTRLRDRASILAGSVGNLGSVDHSSDEETKTATLPSGNYT